MFPRPVLKIVEVTCLDVDINGVLSCLDATGEHDESLTLPIEPHLSDVAETIKEILADGTRECLITYTQWG